MTSAQSRTADIRVEQAGRWCVRLADDGLAVAERREFDAWLAEHPDNEAAFERVAQAWNGFGEAATSPEVVALRAGALEAFRAANTRRWAANDRGPLKWVASAAAVFLAVALPTGIWFGGRPAVYETGVAERQVAMLADGSRLSLDADSEVKVKLGDDRRDVTLTRGRAKFDVAKDPLRPFRVRVGDRIVIATGTSFSVELLNGTAHVILYEGHVAVVNAPEATALTAPGKSTSSEVDLDPGREFVASVDRPGQAVVAADVDRSLSWEAGQLSFSDEPLETAVERVNRYSKTKLVIADADIRQLRVSGVYNAGDVEAFETGIGAVMPVKARRDGDVIALSRR